MKWNASRLVSLQVREVLIIIAIPIAFSRLHFNFLSKLSPYDMTFGGYRLNLVPVFLRRGCIVAVSLNRPVEVDALACCLERDSIGNHAALQPAQGQRTQSC